MNRYPQQKPKWQESETNQTQEICTKSANVKIYIYNNFMMQNKTIKMDTISCIKSNLSERLNSTTEPRIEKTEGSNNFGNMWNVNTCIITKNTCLFFLCWERAALQSVSSEIILEDIPGWIFFAPGARSSSSAAKCKT